MSQEINEEVLRELGFLPDGETDGEFGLHIWDVNQDVVELDDENNIQLVFSVPDQELFLEAYDAELRTVSVTQIPTPTDREALVTLLKGLGVYREQLRDHVSRELAKHMPRVKVTRFDCVTVFQGKSEVVVVGNEVEWVAQYTAMADGHKDYWMKWFPDRAQAEQWAEMFAGEDNCEQTWKRWRVGE